MDLCPDCGAELGLPFQLKKSRKSIPKKMPKESVLSNWSQIAWIEKSSMIIQTAWNYTP